MIKRLIFIILLFIFLINPCKAQTNDILLSGRTPYIQVTSSGGVAWSTLNAQVYYYTPLNPDQNTCVYIVNNNPTSTHTFTLNILQTGDPNVSDFSHNTARWNNTATPGIVSSVLAGKTIYQFVKVNGASKIALQFIGGATQAGSPDTVDVYAVQSSGQGCVNVGDPCSSGTSVKTAVSINNFTTSASIFAGVANQLIYVCGFSIQVTSGTTVTFQFAQAATTACTSPSGMTGVYSPAANVPVSYGSGGSTVFNVVTPGNTLCLILTGTTPRVDGVVTTVAQVVQ